MPNGIIIIDKPAGWTSMDVCAKIRGILHEKRVGHAGTLDPMATGVLPVFAGRATRAVEFAAESGKEYLAGLQLGVVTNTQDITGEVLETQPVNLDRPAVEAALTAFRGEILQVPPMYSAVKIHGKKLYELARKGREVERAARPVTIHSLILEGAKSPGRYLLRVRCSKGTYVRTLCHDIGKALGCGGCLYSLVRTEACGFTLEDAVTLEALQSAADAGGTDALLRPVDSYFARYPALTVDARTAARIRNGSACRHDAPSGEYRVYGPGDEFLMLGRCEKGVLTTVKSFFEV